MKRMAAVDWLEEGFRYMNADEGKSAARPFADLTDEELLAKLREINDTLTARKGSQHPAADESQSIAEGDSQT